MGWNRGYLFFGYPVDQPAAIVLHIDDPVIGCLGWAVSRPYRGRSSFQCHIGRDKFNRLGCHFQPDIGRLLKQGGKLLAERIPAVIWLAGESVSFRRLI